MPIFASPAARRRFSGSWQARQPPCFDQTHDTPVRAKGLLTPADTTAPALSLWLPWNRTHLERIVKRRRKEDADERVSWSSYLHVAGIALVIMVCTVELVEWLLARGS
ncbi:hypothetical protein NB2BOR_A16250 [Bordetella parapertussis]|nr:hypothetical protein NB2BOR_A16250 [Bordetella parapertussis]